MPKTLGAAFVLAKNRLDQPTDRWIELWQIELVAGGTTLYLTNYTRPVRYGVNDYIQYPIRHEGIKEDAQGGIQRLTVRVSNVTREPEYYMQHHDGLRGKKVTLVLLNEAAPTLGDIQNVFLIESASADDQEAVFVLGKAIAVLDARAPRRIIGRDLAPALPHV